MQKVTISMETIFRSFCFLKKALYEVEASGLQISFARIREPSFDIQY